MGRQNTSNLHRWQRSMKIELRNHPAQARHPITREPLKDEEGGPVPLFPNQRGVFLDGYCIGYVATHENAPVCLTQRMSESVRAAVRKRVNEELPQGEKPRAVNMPPAQRPPDLEDDDE